MSIFDWMSNVQSERKMRLKAARWLHQQAADLNDVPLGQLHCLVQQPLASLAVRHHWPLEAGTHLKNIWQGVQCLFWGLNLIIVELFHFIFILFWWVFVCFSRSLFIFCFVMFLFFFYVNILFYRDNACILTMLHKSKISALVLRLQHRPWDYWLTKDMIY